MPDTGSRIFRSPFFWFVLFSVSGFSVLVSYFLFSPAKNNPENDSESHVSEIREQGYTFINPLLECSQAEGAINRNMLSFRSDVFELTERQKKEGLASEIGVYFRDLNNGPWFGVDEKREFVPASLLKIPLMLNFYKIAETRPQVLHEKLTLKAKYPFDGYYQNYPPREAIQVGQEYTIEDLIRRTIIYSDNDAANLVYFEAFPHLESRGFLDNASNALNRDLRYLDEIFGNAKDHVSAKDYAAFFRILFNSSYLDRILSEHALEILAEVDFPDGLRKGVPAEIKIAHKFGEAGSNDSAYELHDCGIIYYPDSPYLLCVMTKGVDQKKLPLVIQQISKLVYEKVDRQVKDSNE